MKLFWGPNILVAGILPADTAGRNSTCRYPGPVRVFEYAHTDTFGAQNRLFRPWCNEDTLRDRQLRDRENCGSAVVLDRID
eukprot:2348063-Rhodomonas_salina.1